MEWLVLRRGIQVFIKTGIKKTFKATLPRCNFNSSEYKSCDSLCLRIIGEYEGQSLSITYYTRMYQAVPTLMPFYRALGGNFVTPRAATARAINRVYSDVSVVRDNRLFGKFSAGHRLLKASDLIVTGAPYKNALQAYGAKKYMVFHGTFAYMTVKEVQAMAHFDRLCVIGPRMMQVVEKAGLADKAMLCGYIPFLDYPMRDEQSRHTFLTNLGLDPAKKTLIYLPWGNPFGSWNLMAEKLLNEIPADYNLILRPHPSQSVTLRLKDRFAFMRLEKIIKARGSAYLDLTAQKLPLLYANADLIISDGTSPAEESLYYDLPQIFVETEHFSREVVGQIMRAKGADDQHIASVTSLYNCGKILTPQTEKIDILVQYALETKDEYADERQRYFSYAFGARNHEAQQNLIESMRQYA